MIQPERFSTTDTTPPTITPEDLDRIPWETRRTVALWILGRAGTFRYGSWMFSPDVLRVVEDALTGLAVDLADPLSEDSTIGHAGDVLRRLMG